MIKSQRQPGISFILRCRNEEQYLQASIESLKDLRLPHEIVVILHRCTDSSKAIVEALKAAGQPIRIFETDRVVSRPGYEMLITPADHPASLVQFYEFCFGQANFNLIMKWDADFRCSPALMEFFNSKLGIATHQPTVWRIGCRLGQNGPLNVEPYLSNCLVRYGKYGFWEIPYFFENYNDITVEDGTIESIPPQVLKNYWLKRPWFLQPNSYDEDLAAKYQLVVDLLGPEPPGVGRANNPECTEIWQAVLKNIDKLKSSGIDFYN